MRRPVLAATLLLACAGAAPAHADVGLEAVGSFAQPTSLSAPVGDTARLFVTERAGTVRLVRAGGAPELFLDLSTLVDDAGEGGLLSLAFSPDYAVSGRLYVYYTDTGADHDIHVREYRVSADPDRADPASGREVLSVRHPTNDNHVGGQLAFGPDGYLYIGVGDGGSGGDPPNNAQNPAQPLGKILRVDPRGTAPGEHAIPPGNAPGAAPEVWALGLRNPWRFSFDRATGALLVGDVGQGSWEEVDLLPAGTAGGVNLGWRRFEGTHVYSAGTVLLGTHTPPIHEYGHAGGNCSITGGFVVRDASAPSLAGRYVYADYCAGALRSLVPALPAATGDAALGLSVAQPISFGEDGLCRVYVLAQGGSVQRLVERPAPAAPGCPAAPPTPPGTPEPPTPTPPGDPGTPAAPVTTGVTAAAEQRLGAVLTRGALTARCTVSAAARCTVVATMSAQAARALGLRRDRRTSRVTFARGGIAILAPGSAAVPVRLSAVARRILGRRATPFRVAVRLQVEALTSAGERDSASATIVLRRR